MGGRVGLIEFDGAQHFAPSSLYHKKADAFALEQEHDRAKTRYAVDHKIPLLRLAHDLDDDQIRAHVQSFVSAVQKHEVGCVLASNDPALYGYLTPSYRHNGGCVLL